MKRLLLLATILFSISLSATIRNAPSCSLSDVQTTVNAATTGDTVVVPAGACTWTGTLTWGNLNFTLQGTSPCTSSGQGCLPMTSAAPVPNSSTSTVITLSTATGISATPTTSPFRITGLYFIRNQAASIAIAINQNSANLGTKVNGFHIDHNVFDDRNYAGNNDVQVNGWLFGLQDHNTHYVPLGDQSTLITENGSGESDSNLSALSGSAAWARTATLGTADSWYIEDSNFFVGNSTSSSSWPNPIMGDGTAGNRFVVRHSTFCGGAVETHGAYSRGSRGTSQWEVYDNDFYPYFSDCATDSSINAGYQYDAIKLRGGTGVIFNNKFHGGSWDSSGGPIYFDVERGNDANAHAPINTRCDGTQAYDGNAAPSTTYGWPCLDQIGRGPGNATPSGFTETQWPVMMWNNVKCTGFACTSPSATTPVIDPAIATHPYQSDLLQSGRDWVVLSGTGESNSSSTPVSQSYASYTYPHPLQSGTPTYSVTLTVGTGGNVTSNDGYFNCGSLGSACSYTLYASGASVTLTATPSSGYTAGTWSGACSGASSTPCVLSSITSNLSAGVTFTVSSGSTAIVPTMPKMVANPLNTYDATNKGYADSHLNGVPFCTGFTPTTGQAVTFTTASSPNPCYTALAGGGVTQIVAGTNVTITPTGGTGAVTINSTSTASTAFSALTGSTNTSAAMLVGTGASLGTTGTGTISATSVTGETFPSSGIIVGTTDTQTLTNKTIDGVTPATMAFVDPTSSIQTQLNSKLATATAATTYVAQTTTVNGHALSSNVTVTASDVGLGSVTNNAQTQAAIVPNTTPSAGQDLVGNAGGTAYAPVTMSGDCTRASTGAITCTKTNGTAFAASATSTTAGTGLNGTAIPTSAPLLGTNSSAQPISVTTLPTSAEPAHTGDVTNTAGSLATTVKGINNTLMSGLGTGLVKNTTGTGVPSIAVSGTDYVVPSGTVASLTGGTTGALLYQSAANTSAFLAGNTTTTPQFVTSTGTGSAAQAPTLTGSTGTSNVVLSVSPTILSPVLSQPSMTPQIIGCSTACSPTAAQLSSAIVSNYGQGSASVVITGPTLTSGMNFILIVGTAPGGSYSWKYTSTGANVYLDGGATAYTSITFATPGIGNSLSCFSFQTGGSTYSLKCTTLAGTSAGS